MDLPSSFHASLGGHWTVHLAWIDPHPQKLCSTRSQWVLYLGAGVPDAHIPRNRKRSEGGE